MNGIKSNTTKWLKWLDSFNLFSVGGSWPTPAIDGLADHQPPPPLWQRIYSPRRYDAEVLSAAGWRGREGALSHGASFHTWCEKTKQAWLVAKLDPNTQKIVNWQLRRRSRKKGIPSCFEVARCHRWWIHRERREYVCELLGPGRATWLLPHSHHTLSWIDRNLVSDVTPLYVAQGKTIMEVWGCVNCHGASFHMSCDKTKEAWQFVAKLDPNTPKNCQLTMA